MRKSKTTSYFESLKQSNNMATVKTNIWDLKVGDIISYSNTMLIVRRITDSSVYCANSFGHNINPYWGEDFNGHRNSFGTIASIAKKYSDFKILRN